MFCFAWTCEEFLFTTTKFSQSIWSVRAGHDNVEKLSLVLTHFLARPPSFHFSDSPIDTLRLALLSALRSLFVSSSESPSWWFKRLLNFSSVNVFFVSILLGWMLTNVLFWLNWLTCYKLLTLSLQAAGFTLPLYVRKYYYILEKANGRSSIGLAGYWDLQFSRVILRLNSTELAPF